MSDAPRPDAPLGATVGTRTYSTDEQALLLLDQSHAWHPYTQHQGMALPIPIARAEGAWLYGTDGRPVLDAVSSWWVTTHGHCRPEIADAIAEQARTLDHVMFAGFTHEPAAELAAALAARLPRGLTRVFCSDNGSTAVEVALKMSLQAFANAGTPRRLVAALDNAYHGDTFGAMAASGRGVFTTAFEPLFFEVARLPDPSEGDTLAALDALLDARGTELAAVIVEPLLLGAGGMRVWDERVLQGIRARTRAAGVHLIADEVLTGFGRTGPLWACDRADVAPDLMCLSKGITGGFLPLGATAATERIFDAFLGERTKTFFHGHSYTANPIACAAARAALSLHDDASEDARIGLEVAQAGHLAALAGHPGVRATRQLGTVAAVELAGTAGYLSEVGREMSAFALQEGVLLRPLGNVVYVLPPYCTTHEELGRAHEVIARFLDGERADDARGGDVD
ncbi:MAG: adenosylmethionine--8-amino-7-oxononanoate transaminase [Candidatus Brachytrichaceae bacterium NZ_4S206]|jgi:adenosylmethionine-8-amino-7-oxononanoate aminotransferase